MTANRRADLQRKLALAPVPKPPAGLADRIKNEIPKELRFNAEKERARLSSSVGFSLRVAASIILLISAAYLGLRVVSRTGDKQLPAAVTAAKEEAVQAAPPATTPPQPVAVAEARRAKQRANTQSRVATLEKKAELRDQRKPVDAEQTAAVSGAPRPSAATTAAEGGSAPPRARSDALAAAAPPPRPIAVAESITVSEPAPAVMQRSDRAALKVARTAQPRAVDIGLVRRFSAPVTLEPGKIIIDVEAAEQTLAPGKVVIRASFDSGAVARDVRVDVVLNSEIAASARWLAQGWRWATGELANKSHTTLVEVPLPNDDTPLATIRAFYRVGADPDEESIEKVIRRADIKPWSAASRRTKAGALAGLWRAGDDPAAIAAAARAAGIDDLATEIEKR